MRRLSRLLFAITIGTLLVLATSPDAQAQTCWSLMEGHDPGLNVATLPGFRDGILDTEKESSFLMFHHMRQATALKPALEADRIFVLRRVPSQLHVLRTEFRKKPWFGKEPAKVIDDATFTELEGSHGRKWLDRRYDSRSVFTVVAIKGEELAQLRLEKQIKLVDERVFAGEEVVLNSLSVEKYLEEKATVRPPREAN